MSQVAEVYYFNGNKKKANMLLNNALEKGSTKYDSAYIYQQMHYIYRNDSKFEDALKAYEKHTKLYNQIIDEDSKNKVARMDIKYENAEKELKIAEQNLKIEREQSNRNIALLGSGVLFFIIIGGFAYNKQIQQKKEFEKEKEFKKLQYNITRLGLSNLNNQIQTHDFKNTLSGALAEVQEKAPQSYQHINTLLQITETALYTDDFTDTLKNQLNQAEGIIKLAQLNMFETIEYKINSQLDEEVLLPKLVLKNLVENAIKHGIQGNTSGKININTYQKSEAYVIEVTNTGNRLTTTNSKGKGISTYQQLFSYFNKKNNKFAKLDLQSIDHGVRAMVTLPINYKFVA
jgi:two-component sensor histidine kinase